MFLAKLFESEIPEVFDGIITVKEAVVRIPGEKSQGGGGVLRRPHRPRRRLCRHERVTYPRHRPRTPQREHRRQINYTTNQQLFIQRALSPAKISNMVMDEERRHVDVYLPADQVSLGHSAGAANNIRFGQPFDRI